MTRHPPINRDGSSVLVKVRTRAGHGMDSAPAHRPDLLLWMRTGNPAPAAAPLPTPVCAVIIETDEHQHKTRGYTEQKEQERMRAISSTLLSETTPLLVSQHLRVMGVRFLRFNPHAYTPPAGEKTLPLPERMHALRCCLNTSAQACARSPILYGTRSMHVKYMFYDCTQRGTNHVKMVGFVSIESLNLAKL